jgi:hypothetical protein
VPAGRSYWLKGFADLNGDGVWQAAEPPGRPAPPVTVTADGVRNATLRIEKVRGMRVDFGEYYGGMWEGLNSTDIAARIVTDAADWGVNTIYARALSPVYGTFWSDPTTAYLCPEGGHGAAGILGSLIACARKADVRVIAWIQPLNANTRAWTHRPEWRLKRRDGSDWAPEKGLLTPFNPDCADWMAAVVGEVLAQGVDGVDIAETDYDNFTTTAEKALTYDAAATNRYFRKYRSGKLGDARWFRMRQEALTSDLYARIGGQVVSRGKEYHVTYTWDAQPDGVLQPAAVLAHNTGFSFEDLVNLPESSRPDFVIPEFIWQSEAGSHPDTYPRPFHAGWTAYAARTYAAWVGGRTLPGIHPEITRQAVGSGWIPTLAEFEATLRHAATNTAACDFFVHHLAVTNGYLPNGRSGDSYGWQAVSNVFRSVP